VIAVFDAGFDQYDSKLVYTDLYEAQAFGDSGDSVTGIEMKVKDIDGPGYLEVLQAAGRGSTTPWTG
jgi:lipoprotein-releasing system permease protein